MDTVTPDGTYKMDRSSFWRHGVATMRSIPCPLPLDNKLGTCTAHRDGGRALSAGTPYRNTRHESCPSEDSSGRAHHHMPSVAGSCECPQYVQNPPTEQNITIKRNSQYYSEKRERETCCIYSWNNPVQGLFCQNMSCFSCLTVNSNPFS